MYLDKQLIKCQSSSVLKNIFYSCYTYIKFRKYLRRTMNSILKQEKSGIDIVVLLDSDLKIKLKRFFLSRKINTKFLWFR